MKKRVLFVDDEKNILSSLRRTFSDDNYETFFASSGIEAIKLLSTQKIDMVVSDMRMPEMDGYNMLHMISTIQPLAIRVILSGYADKQTVLKAIADGTAKAYLTKPWDNTKLKADLARLFSVYDAIRKDDHLELIGKINRMPVLPQVYHNLIRLIQSDAEVSKIVSYIEKDPGYVAKMLGIVNSCLYGVSIGSVKQAVVYLGLDTVKNIILSSEMFDVFRATSINRDEIESIWRHSSLMSILFHKIYQKATGKQIPEEYATTGPLHDIGMLLMLQYFPAEYKMIQDKSKKEPNRLITEIEQEVIGVPHTVMGGYLLDFWNLPYYLVEGCLYHHTPLSPTVHEKQIMAITNIADTISWNSVRHRDYSSGIDPILFEIAGISADLLFEDLKDMFSAQLQ